MHCEYELAHGLYWIGGDDKRLGVFEGQHPVPEGMAYNNYLLLDEKNVLFDTIDRAVEERFYGTLAHVLEERKLDYIIVQHMEPDHSATLGEVARRYPEAQLVCTAICKKLVEQFHGAELANRALVVKDGDELCCGARTLVFKTAPMVHWPEVMVTYDAYDKILFSADAFGAFGALDGRLFDDGYSFEDDLLPKMRRYYASIVGKYGKQVLDLLDTAKELDIELVCPLHGPMVRANLAQVVEKHRLWGSYEPEEKGVVIAYASVYGGTRDVAEALAVRLLDRGVTPVSVFDLSVQDPSYVLSEAFRVSNVVLASMTQDMGLFPKMEALLHLFKAHGLKNRAFSFVQNGSWAPQSGKLMQKAVEELPDCTVVGEVFTIKSRMAPGQEAELDALVDAIIESF